MSSRYRKKEEDRFYSPPAMRRQQQPQHHFYYKTKTTLSHSTSSQNNNNNCNNNINNNTNFSRFLEYTTPSVNAQFFPKTSMRGWRTSEHEVHPYFVLGDLWESFKEWSAYGAGVPLVLNGCNSVMQYYVPFLSGIQLYIDPSKTNLQPGRPGEESDLDSSRETSSDSSSEYGTDRRASKTPSARGQQSTTLATTQSFSRLSLRNMGPTLDGSEVTNPPGLLTFEYLEHDTPYSREPLSDKIAVLASKFPELRTYRSCDLTAASWISVAWYPIYRIPTGPTLQSLDACFLTFHSLSTPFKSTNADRPHVYAAQSISTPLKLSLPIFGLASYKFKVSVWNPNGVHESQKVNSLLHAADNWLRLLQVDHPDFRFFVSHSSYRR